MIGLGMDATLGWLGEPPVDHAAPQPGVAGLHADKRLGQLVLTQGHAEIGHDLCGGVEAVEHAQQPRARMVCAKRAGRGGVPGEREEVVALVLVEPQGAGERRGRLLRWPRAAPLLQARVEVGGHVREPGNLLAPQAARATTLPGMQTHVIRP